MTIPSSEFIPLTPSLPESGSLSSPVAAGDALPGPADQLPEHRVLRPGSQRARPTTYCLQTTQ